MLFKQIAFLIFSSFFIINSSALALSAKTPSWVKRENIHLKDGEFTWFLGINEDENIKYAYTGAEIASRKNIYEYIGQETQLQTQASSSQELELNKHSIMIAKRSNELPIPLYKKRYYTYKEDGKFTVYMDLAVNNQDIAHYLKTKEPIQFDYNLQNKILEKNTWSGNDEEEAAKNYRDYNHYFSWTPLRSDESTIASFSYDHSFFNRWVAIEIAFMYNDRSSKIEYNGSTADKIFKYQKQKYTLFANIYGTEMTEIKIGLGVINFTREKNIELSSNKVSSLRETFSGQHYTIKINRLSSTKSYWGYIFEVQDEKYRDKRNNQSSFNMGFFWRF